MNLIKEELFFSFSVQTSENAAVETVITQISATDTDIGLNGKLTYKLISGNEQGTCAHHQI